MVALHRGPAPDAIAERPTTAVVGQKSDKMAFPTVVIRLTQGPERLKTTTLLATSDQYPSAIAALEALVPRPPGWYTLNFSPTYAVYVAPDESNHCLHSINATVFADIEFAPL